MKKLFLLVLVAIIFSLAVGVSHAQLSLGVDLSCGPINLSALGSSSTSKAYPLGAGLFAKYSIFDSTDILLGAHYISKTEGLQLSYGYLDLSGKNGNFVSAVGVNYSIWNVDGMPSSVKFTGGLGYQAMVGYTFLQNFLLGVKYIAMNSIASSTGSSTTLAVNASQVLLYVSTI
jgi:hypothetical protein